MITVESYYEYRDEISKRAITKQKIKNVKITFLNIHLRWIEPKCSMLNGVVRSDDDTQRDTLTDIQLKICNYKKTLKLQIDR